MHDYYEHGSRGVVRGGRCRGGGRTSNCIIMRTTILLPLTSVFVILLVKLYDCLCRNYFLVRTTCAITFQDTTRRHPSTNCTSKRLGRLLRKRILSFKGRRERVGTKVLQIRIALRQRAPLTQLTTINSEKQLGMGRATCIEGTTTCVEKVEEKGRLESRWTSKTGG